LEADLTACSTAAASSYPWPYLAIPGDLPDATLALTLQCNQRAISNKLLATRAIDDRVAGAERPAIVRKCKEPQKTIE